MPPSKAVRPNKAIQSESQPLHRAAVLSATKLGEPLNALADERDKDIAASGSLPTCAKRDEAPSLEAVALLSRLLIAWRLRARAPARRDCNQGVAFGQAAH